ncbi:MULTISPECIES: hypothetical protein [Acinetobacter]|jgi:hypothetical protein|uniref:Uncharacterized protein n=1 Tax=Acinetobacter populi TaxID=1582270 RepID=A0A1Z9YXS6_9GAMM|nr:hypothetical protein [Acinetobacter populi]MCH4246479.1 hypothetical protein [Acinetobacter populi]OUY06982.1 hypothetical protein CAP51_09810 [Acinetobacter populi]
MSKRLKDYNVDERKDRPAISGQILPISFGKDEATKRVVMHSAKRVIKQHREEIQELAYK